MNNLEIKCPFQPSTEEGLNLVLIVAIVQSF